MKLRHQAPSSTAAYAVWLIRVKLQAMKRQRIQYGYYVQSESEAKPPMVMRRLSRTEKRWLGYLMKEKIKTHAVCHVACLEDDLDMLFPCFKACCLALAKAGQYGLVLSPIAKSTLQDAGSPRRVMRPIRRLSPLSSCSTSKPAND